MIFRGAVEVGVFEIKDQVPTVPDEALTEINVAVTVRIMLPRDATPAQVVNEIDDLRRIDDPFDADRVGDDVFVGVVAQFHDQFAVADGDCGNRFEIDSACRVIGRRVEFLIDIDRGELRRVVVDGVGGVGGAIGPFIPGN